MIKTVLKTLLLLAAVGYLVFALVKVSRPAHDMVCTGVEYLLTDSGETRLIDEQMVANMLAQKKISPKGKSLGDIDIKNIEHLLSANPYIDTATCYSTASGKLCIRVTPAHPLLHVFTQDDEFYVGKHGEIMPAGGISNDLPIVTGNVTQKYASTQLITLGTFLKENAYWNKLTQQINVDSKGNLEIIPNISSQKIFLGEPKHIAEKLERVRLFYEKALPKAGWNKYTTINAAYNNQIICKKE